MIDKIQIIPAQTLITGPVDSPGIILEAIVPITALTIPVKLEIISTGKNLFDHCKLVSAGATNTNNLYF